MPLTFPDDFTYVGVTTAPRRQFELDQLTRHWKTNGATEEEVLAASGLPAVGNAHPLFPKMFVVALNATEFGQSACALDVIYMGATQTDGEGNPVLPASKSYQGNPIQTASSSGDPVTGVSANATVEFHAKISRLVFWSYLTAGALGTVPDPSGDPLVRSILVDDTAYAPSSLGIDQTLALFFQLAQTDTMDVDEIVAGKFYRNQEIKTLFYGPHLVVIVAAGAGKAVALFNPGRGYDVSDTLTCSYLGADAVMSVTSVGSGGLITGFSVVSDDISAPIYLVIGAIGGSGTGASFRFYGA